MVVLLFTVSVRVNGETKRNTTETRQSGNGSSIWVVSSNKVHNTSTDGLAHFGGASYVAQGRHSNAAWRTWSRIWCAIVHKAGACCYQCCHCATFFSSSSALNYYGNPQNHHHTHYRFLSCHFLQFSLLLPSEFSKLHGNISSTGVPNKYQSGCCIMESV